MKKAALRKCTALIFVLIILTSAVGCQNSEEDSKLIKTTVTRVVDGDTIIVKINNGEERVRMIGVNTPETHHPTKPVESYGPEAEKFTRSQLEGRQVWLELDVQKRDKYKRMLAYIWLEQPLNHKEDEIRNKMFNAKLLLDGYAQVMTVPPNVKYAEVFVKFQKEARENKHGLWGITAEEQHEKLSSKNGPGPNGETIKGNINSRGEKIYHVPGGKYYEQTVPEEWFFTEEEAQQSGYRKSKM